MDYVLSSVLFAFWQPFLSSSRFLVDRSCYKCCYQHLAGRMTVVLVSLEAFYALQFSVMYSVLSSAQFSVLNLVLSSAQFSVMNSVLCSAQFSVMYPVLSFAQLLDSSVVACSAVTVDTIWLTVIYHSGLSLVFYAFMIIVLFLACTVNL